MARRTKNFNLRLVEPTDHLDLEQIINPVIEGIDEAIASKSNSQNPRFWGTLEVSSSSGQTRIDGDNVNVSNISASSGSIDSLSGNSLCFGGGNISSLNVSDLSVGGSISMHGGGSISASSIRGSSVSGDSLSFTSGHVDSLGVSMITGSELEFTSGSFSSLGVSSITGSELGFSSGTFSSLGVSSITGSDLDFSSGSFSSLSVWDSLSGNRVDFSSGGITHLTGSDLGFSSGSFGSLFATGFNVGHVDVRGNFMINSQNNSLLEINAHNGSVSGSAGLFPGRMVSIQKHVSGYTEVAAVCVVAPDNTLVKMSPSTFRAWLNNF